MNGWNPTSGHPPLPLTSEGDLISQLRLLRSPRVGPATFHRLVAEHGSADMAVKALPALALNRGVKNYRCFSAQQATQEYKAGVAQGAILLSQKDPRFPLSLKAISDAPPLLWVMGQAETLNRPMVALVGARNASSNGTRMARRLASALCEAGVLVVSGLARGIDTAAHMASLSHGTIAVLAGGVDRIYPEENTHLGRDILTNGARVSEQPIGLQAQARHFPRRNRIISGMAQAVVVVEAAAKSGTLITARQALDQGRDVLAVPGHPVDARAAGCNALIRDGATLVRTAEDILSLLSLPSKIVDRPKVLKAAEPAQPFAPKPLQEVANLHRKILNRLGPAPTPEDQLGRDLNVASSALSGALVELELEGEIERQSGGMVAKIPRN